MKVNPSRYKGPNLPVTRVDWHECQRFCEALTKRERAAGDLPKGARYGLPTEAEWEYACRAGSTTKFCFGDDRSWLKWYAWYKDNDGGKIHGVAQRRPNAWGLYDMHGNVAEWCQDWYSERYYQECRAQGAVRDPQGPDKGKTCVLRGRSWLRDPDYCRSAARLKYQASDGHPMFGFRVCLRGF